MVEVGRCFKKVDCRGFENDRSNYKEGLLFVSVYTTWINAPNWKFLERRLLQTEITCTFLIFLFKFMESKFHVQ